MKITREWLDQAFLHRVDVRDGELVDEWWDCGLRHDNGVGIMRIRVLAFAGDDYGVEIAQNVDGASVEWSSGIMVTVSTVDEVVSLVEAVLMRNKVSGGVRNGT